MPGLRRSAFLAFVIVLVACGARTQLDAVAFGSLGSGGAKVGLRLVAPLSTSTVTTQAPTLRWLLAPGKDGAQIDICRDRACSGDVVTFTATGTRATPPKTLAAGLYFWRARSMEGGKVGDVSSPVWEFWVPARSTPVDTSWGTTLDVNGDGAPDLAVGAPLAESNLGRAYVYLGGTNGFTATPQTTLTGNPIPSTADQGFFGTTVGSAGDLNGDGYGDFFVGSMSDRTGDPLVTIFLGGPSGITTPQIVLSDHGVGAYQASAAAAGDVNGDGFGDLVVGELVDFETTSVAWVYFGSENGIVATSATMVAGPIAPGAMDGPIVTSAGDLNGDGFGDFFVGADYFLNVGGGDSMLYLGGSSGPTKIATLVGPGGVNLLYGSTPPCAADLDGDGLTDIVVRGGTVGGSALLYKGGATVASTPTTTITGTVPDDGWGVAFAAADVDGDGFMDLLVGSNGVGNATGVVYFYPGGASGVAPLPAMEIIGPDGDSTFFGTSVASAGDVDHDGYGDIIVGAMRVNDDKGRAHLYLGGASGLAADPKTTFEPPDGGRFGAAVD
jgi:hypothetical protein